MTLKVMCTVGSDTNRIPISLPPPYTWTGTKSGQLRANPNDFTTTSTLLVGPKATPFLIHTTLLTSQSPYFRAALTGRFAEASENTIRLDDVDVSHLPTPRLMAVHRLHPTALQRRQTRILHAPPRLRARGPPLLRRATQRRNRPNLRPRRRTNSVLTPSDTRILARLRVMSAVWRFAPKCVEAGTAMAGWDDGRSRWVDEEDGEKKRKWESSWRFGFLHQAS
ncbi:hypothetical protein SNOG_12138 [Parastagonospora nodorum SN15]|uniref:BTB domain-containing protein n=1 Tax=Phaeosphaeria nodorum (strain SN15 / ATCC MYA-4574 / FGSC 10173) TaxID=321614 RepID=Q0U7X6_PHANO|nr:hypothetical protein SNOG_12138 [Parastagonospora nodorum SN15]EAT80550.1 hypothetical protein SNOG_12138 [Parastagonospora nodorum SN15]